MGVENVEEGEFILIFLVLVGAATVFYWLGVLVVRFGAVIGPPAEGVLVLVSILPFSMALVIVLLIPVILVGSAFLHSR